MMGRLLGAFLLAVCAGHLPAGVAAEACRPLALTEQDALTWTGTPEERMAAQYPLGGKDGKAAVEALEASGFRCEFDVTEGVMLGKSGVAFAPGRLPVYRCSKADPGSCDCPHPQIAFAAGVQAPGRSAQEYRSLVDSAKIKPGYTCLER
jgi:hypothetical protein